jgi:methylglutaconyl-CoA hydratase
MDVSDARLEENVKYTTILVADDPPTRTITLNRPHHRNAITPEMQSELIAALEDGATSECRVLVFIGAGKTFCSGLDLAVMKNLADRPAGDHRADAERTAKLFRTLYEFPKPTIAAVEGAAIAGGTGLATICDFTLATPEAKFGFTETRIGFVPALVSAFLALQIGDKLSRDLLLTGRFFDAAEAYRIGLVNEIVPADQLVARVQALAGELSLNSPQSHRATKALLAAQNKTWLDAAIVLALQANANARQTEDFRQGVTAFLNKRKPKWAE